MQAVGRYRLQEEIGRGANGVVYRAWDPERKEDVAVKILTEIDPKKRARFRTEVRTLARLRHPNLVTVLAYGEHQGHLYLVMEFVAGGSLQDELSQRGALAVARAVELAHALAQAVAYAHSCAVIHRDIKPDNVLLTAKGEPKLTDFGLARDLDATHARLTRSQASMGTPGYWAPEQASGKREQISELTDVYGLGATLYAMLTGGPPIRGRGYLELVQRTLEDAPLPPSRLVPEVWAELEAICLRALAKRPEQRFPSATNFARELHASLRGPRTPPRPRRRRAWSIGTAATLLLCGGVGLWAVGGGEEQPDPEVVATSPLEEQARRAYEAKDFAALRTLAGSFLEETPESPLGHLWRGVALADAGDYDAAEDALRVAYAVEETSAQAAFELGQLHFRQADDHAAEDWARRAIELEPGHLEASWLLANALLQQERLDEAARVLEEPSQGEGEGRYRCCILLGDVRMAQRRYLEAEEALRRAQTLEPEATAALQRLALVYGHTKRYEEAEQVFAEALRLSDDDTQILLDRAKLRLVSGNPRDALEDARRALELDPGEVEALLVMGQVHFTTGEHERAVQQLQAALKLEPNHPLALFAYGQALTELNAFDAARMVLDRLIQLQPEHLGAYFLRAICAREMSDFDQAVSDFNRVVEIEGGTEANTYASLGTLYREFGRLEQAARYYERALALDSRCAAASYGRGLCLMFSPGRRAEALSELRAGISGMQGANQIHQHWIGILGSLPSHVDPPGPSAWIDQGRGFLEQGQFERAAMCFAHALELGGGGQRQLALAALGKCYALLGEPERAELEFTRALWIGPSPDVFSDRAIGRSQRGDIQGALSDYETALELMPGHPQALLGRGSVLAKLGEFERAGADFADYVKRRPEDPQGWGRLALVAFTLEDYPSAIHAATQGLGLDPNEPGLLELRGMAYALSDRPQRGRQDIDRALQLDPSNTGIRFKRMTLLQELGEHALACEDGQVLLTRSPDSPEVLTALASSLVALGKHERALGLFRRALDRYPEGSVERARVQQSIDRLQGEGKGPR